MFLACRIVIDDDDLYGGGILIDCTCMLENGCVFISTADLELRVARRFLLHLKTNYLLHLYHCLPAERRKLSG